MANQSDEVLNQKGQSDAPIQFLVFAVAGLVVGFFGYHLSLRQERVESWAKDCVKRINDWFGRFFFESAEDDILDEDGGNAFSGSFL